MRKPKMKEPKETVKTWARGGGVDLSITITEATATMYKTTQRDRARGK